MDELKQSSQNKENSVNSGNVRLLRGFFILSLVFVIFLAVAVAYLINLNKRCTKELQKAIDAADIYEKNRRLENDVEVLPEKTSMSVSPEDIMKSSVNITVKEIGRFVGKPTVISNSTGVFIRNGGYVLASKAALEYNGDIYVNTYDSKSYPADIIGFDNDEYFCILKINSDEYTSADIGDSDKLLIGDKIIGIGNRASNDLSNPLSFGNICGYDRNVEARDGAFINLFQTDCNVLSDSVGGLMFDLNGKLLGLCTAKYSVSGSGLGFVTPINDINEKIEGVLNNVNAPDTEKLGIIGTDAAYGVAIEKIAEGSIAENAGFCENDIIMKINGNPIKSVDEIQKIQNSCNSGDKMDFSIYRAGETIELSVTVK